jgi:hypothetical protein
MSFYSTVRGTLTSYNVAALSAGLASTAGLVAIWGCSSPGSGFPLFPGMGAAEKIASEGSHDAEACPTPEKCAAQLKILVSDPIRNWVGQAQSPDAYTNGTRLFAYRALKKKLTCDELGRALAEMEAASPSLQAARYDTARKLMSVVRHELGAERTKRCAARQQK